MYLRVHVRRDEDRKKNLGFGPGHLKRNMFHPGRPDPRIERELAMRDSFIQMNTTSDGIEEFPT